MVPIVAMGVSYGHIGRVLWGRKNFTGEAAATSEAHERKLASKRKVCARGSMKNVNRGGLKIGSQFW